MRILLVLLSSLVILKESEEEGSWLEGRKVSKKEEKRGNGAVIRTDRKS